MLKVLRKKGVMKRILWVIAVVIILVFGFLGQSYLLNSRGVPTYAGKIFGQQVSIQDFQRQYQDTVLQAQLMYGDNFRLIEDRIDFESEAWNRLILLHEARKQGIKIQDEKVVETVKQNRFFRTNEKFDRLLYEDIIRNYFHITPRRFEESLRDTLIIGQLMEQETSGIIVPEGDILAAYKQDHEKVQISYIYFSSESYKDQIAADEPQIKNYYENSKSEFIKPDMIDAEYIHVDFPPKPEAPATDSNQNDLTDGEKPADSTHLAEWEKAKTDAYGRAEKISIELQENPDFEKIAADNGLTVTSTGLFSREQPKLEKGWSFPIILQLFQMKAGEISAPIEAVDSYQIIRIKNKQTSYLPEYNEIKDKVTDAWKISQAGEIARNEAKDALEALKKEYDSKKVPDFVGIAKDLGLTIVQTPIFKRGDYLPTIGLSKNFQDTAFSLTEDTSLSDVTPTERGYAILHLDKKEPIDTEDYKKNYADYEQKLLSNYKQSAFNSFTAHLRLKANLENNILRLQGREAKPDEKSPADDSNPS